MAKTHPPTDFQVFLSSIKDGSAFQLQLKDRISAGKVLAMVLKTIIKRKKDEKLVVLGVPRGGVIKLFKWQNEDEIPAVVETMRREAEKRNYNDIHFLFRQKQEKEKENAT